MDSVSTMLRSRASYITAIVAQAVKYIEIIKKEIMGADPGEYNAYISNIDILNNIAARLQAVQIGDGVLLAISQIYEDLATAGVAIEDVINVMNNTVYAKQALRNMSASYVMNIYQLRNIAIENRDKYLSKSATDDETIFTTTFGAIDLKSDDTFNFILRTERINKFIVRLIGATIAVSTGSRRRRLELIIEKQKDNILQAGRVDISDYPGVQGMLVRYGLRPVTQSMPLAELFDLLGHKYLIKDTPANNFKILSEKYGVIVIHANTPNPIEFDVRGLIDDDYIASNDLQVKSQSGLTKKVLKKYETLKILPRGGPPQSMIRLTTDKSDIYIFETLNDQSYRLLGTSLGPVPRNQIIGMIDGVSLRPHRYNDIQSEQILKNCFDPRAKIILSSYEEKRQTNASSLTIKNHVIDTLREWYDGVLRTTPPKNANGVRDGSIDLAIITETILNAIEAPVNINSEYILTYMTKFDKIVRAFVRAIDQQWSAQNIPDRIFREMAEPDLHQYIMNIYVSVITAAADALDRTHVWTDMDVSIKEHFIEQMRIII